MKREDSYLSDINPSVSMETVVDAITDVTVSLSTIQLIDAVADTAHYELAIMNMDLTTDAAQGPASSEATSYVYKGYRG